MSPLLQTEEAAKDWAQSVQVGATDLILSLECHQLQHLSLNMQCKSLVMDKFHYVPILNKVLLSVIDSLCGLVKLVNSKGHKQKAFFLS